VTESILIVVGLVFCLALDLVLIAARMSYSQSNHARLFAMREQAEKQEDRNLIVIPNLIRLRASLNVMLVLLRFALAGLLLWLVTSPAFSLSRLWTAGVVLLSALLLFWFEWFVERAVSRQPEAWVFRMNSFARLLTGLTSVLLFPLNLSKEAQTPPELVSSVTQDELKSLVDAGQEEGIFERDERRMIYSIFQLGDTLAREIMVPRIDMLAFDVHTPLPISIDALLQSGFSRVPVFEETIDNMLGLLYAKDLLSVWREGGKLDSLRELIRPAYFVPEAKKVDELLAEMQKQRIHMAIVVDEYGGVAGLVTLEDIVEEIVGEIQDEYDQAEEAPYQEVSEGNFLFLGRIDMDDFNEVMGSSLPTDEADTLGGYIYSQLGRVPASGDRVQKDGLLLTVDQVSARRIRKVRAKWLKAEGESEIRNEKSDGR
jgi:putative hemolysin